MVAKEYRSKRIPIDDITVPRGWRIVQDDKAKSLAQSIQAVGLLEPIGVTDEGRLVFGAHRIAAYKLLGLKSIPAVVIEGSKDQIRLAQIDENLERNQLKSLEWAEQLKERKAIYLRLHPETEQHVAGGKGNLTTANMAVVQPSFAADTAAQTGIAERTIRRDVQIAEAIPQDVRDAIRDTPVADNKADLQKLAALPPKKQRAVAKKVAAGDSKAIKKAVKAEREPGDDTKSEKEYGETHDPNGLEIPVKLRPIFEQQTAFRSVVLTLSKALGELNELRNTPAGAFLVEQFESIKLDIDNARRSIKFCAPHQVCPYCKGAGCKRNGKEKAPCRGTGWTIRGVKGAGE